MLPTSPGTSTSIQPIKATLITVTVFDHPAPAKPILPTSPSTGTSIQSTKVAVIIVSDCPVPAEPTVPASPVSGNPNQSITQWKSLSSSNLL